MAIVPVSLETLDRRRDIVQITGELAEEESAVLFNSASTD